MVVVLVAAAGCGPNAPSRLVVEQPRNSKSQHWQTAVHDDAAQLAEDPGLGSYAIVCVARGRRSADQREDPDNVDGGIGQK